MNNLKLTIAQRLFSGGLWVSGGKIVSLLCNLAINAFIARLLEPEDVGVFFLILSLVNFSMLFSLLGMERSIVRIVSESIALNQRRRARDAIHYVLQIGLVSSSLVAIFLYSGLGRLISIKIFNSNLIGTIIFYPAIMVVLFTIQRLIAESFRGLHDIRLATVFNGALTSIFTVIFLFILLFQKNDATITNILLIVILSYVMNIIIAIVIFANGDKKWRRNEVRMISRFDVLKTSWLLHLTNISYFILINAHLWILAYFSNKESVAIFGAVLRIVVLITTTISMAQLIILPTIGDLYTKKQYDVLEGVLRISATISGLPTCIAMLIIVVFGKNLLSFVFGEYYSVGYISLMILSVAQLSNVFTGNTGTLMVMAEKEKYLLIFSVLSVMLGSIVSFFLVKPFNLIGVSIGCAVGITIQSLLMLIFCMRNLSINTCMDIKYCSAVIKNPRLQIPIIIKKLRVNRVINE